MKVLFIGGSGVISAACSRLAVEKGIDLTLLNRGETSLRSVPEDARLITADYQDLSEIRSLLKNETFDVVVNWIVYTPDQIENDLSLFEGRTGQYVFISSASAYQTPPDRLPVTENTPLENPFWAYSRNKIACEERLMEAWRVRRFPVTIVRPSHTYDATQIPLWGRWTAIERMRRGIPVVIHGDGTSLWTLTHHEDFAPGLVGLLGHPKAVGEAFHITSDEILSWNQIAIELGRAAGVPNPVLVHVASETIARYDADLGPSLMGDKAVSMIFDNRKIRETVPEFNPVIRFSNGAGEIIGWYESDPDRCRRDPRIDHLMDRLVADHGPDSGRS